MSSIGNEDYVLVRRSEVKTTESKAAPTSSSTSSASSSSAVVLKAAAGSAPSTDAKLYRSLARMGLSAENKGGFETILNYWGATGIVSGSTGASLAIYASLAGEFTEFATVFQQYRVSKVAITVDTHALTSIAGAYDAGTVSSLTGCSIAHTLQPGLPAITDAFSVGEILDCPRAKLLDYGISKNLFKLTTETMCFNAADGTCVPSKEWQTCSQVANHIWALHVLNKYPTTLPRSVVFPMRVQLWVHFKRRK